MALEPERRLATVFAAASGVQPPVDIEALARAHADLERTLIPNNVDGLLLRRAGKRPLILISSKLAVDSPRYRFTLAHELGHNIIPWQLGDSLCHIDDQGCLNASGVEAQEAEANRFAAELLVPTAWVEARYADRSGPLVQHVLQLATAADVSPSVAMFAVRRVARPGTLLLIHDGRRINHAVASPRSFCPCPEPGDAFAGLQKEWSDARCTVSQATIGPRWLVCVEFPEVAEIPDLDSRKEARVLIKELVGEFVADEKGRLRLLGRINGFISTVNVSAYRESDKHMYAGILRKFDGLGDELGPITKHPRFKEYLALKARELTEAKPKKSKKTD